MLKCYIVVNPRFTASRLRRAPLVTL
jgi:hypothetical protein